MDYVISLTIDAVDRTDEILVDSIVKKDEINEKRDTLKFRLSDPTFTPEVGQEVILEINAVREFGGTILNIDKTIQDGTILVYDISCVDYTQQLDRKLVLDTYTALSPSEIAISIINEYTTGFTTTGVVACGVDVTTISFNRVTVAEALTKLASIVNYFWYVDYNKDLHFFPRYENPAPFTITDDNDNYIRNTLNIKKDLSQLRNRITVRGDEEEGDVRTESYIADGEKVMFSTANKFATLPTVVVNGTTSSVGLDYLTPDADADCFWSYEQKYIKFKDTTKPAVSQVVSFTGTPLFPVIVQATEPISVSVYGEYEIFKKDKTIKSRADALQYASAELTAYKDGVVEGQFSTNTQGLKSGQLITINSVIMGVDETFIIQSVETRVLAVSKIVCSVKLATYKTMGIIDFLQNLLKKQDERDPDPENLLSFYKFADSAGIADLLGSFTNSTTKLYVYADKTDPSDVEGIYNFSTFSD